MKLGPADDFVDDRQGSSEYPFVVWMAKGYLYLIMTYSEVHADPPARKRC